jgi:U3 small nucleolar RNA-associated protein 4
MTTEYIQGASGAFAVYDLAVRRPTQSRWLPEQHVRGRKRRRLYSVTNDPTGDTTNKQTREETTVTVCVKYTGVLFMDYMSDHEMVLVEQPWLSVMASLPDALDRRVYGGL